ncbi:hypothetical protein BCIN_06g04270 [Botrytis cinerea B05.10]|uniref:SMODS and SLOG-associating 2TM effector domain-containing protein n=3 Tax=Botryotinia fuckeliana TaxID=40559 RepID=A0A384JK82_BOTFB|nr:hypothetical protein BCIN_06g04270 [Botrytis cinerea B05.10]ATZ50963.1 hypothetical protein BCIN_06g04270 [Botrytis cinerea B05.10]EMR86423.1 putative c6 transcription protein [Botrytis cinerea BcDW1]
MSAENTPLLSELTPSHHRPASTSSSVSFFPPALQKFRLAVGINVPVTSPAMFPPSDFENLRGNSYGIYKSVLVQQRNFSLQYHLMEGVYYISILSQLFIGGVLASSGQLSQTYPQAVPILGVANTCLAGVLGLLKSQGLPDRLRKDEFEMRKVQDFIEECDARLAIGWGETISESEVDGLIKEVFDHYSVARDTTEMNRPTNYTYQADGDGTGNRGAMNLQRKMHSESANPRRSVGGRQSNISVGGNGKSLQIY